jgi:predicted permease
MMRLLHAAIGLARRLASWPTRRRLERDIDDEVAFHLAMREADLARENGPAAEPALAARRQFGNVTAIKEQTREMWTFPSFDSLAQDVRYGLRSLRKTPAFTIVAVVVLALGIGANTAIFSLVDALFVRGLPYPGADRLVVLIGNVQRTVVERRGGSYPDFLDWRSRSTRFEAMSIYSASTATLMIPGTGADAQIEPERVPMEAVSAAYFSVLGVPPAQGRAFRADEDTVPGRDAVAIISDGLWKRRFGADPQVVNRKVEIGARIWTIVGIAPPGFAGVSDQADLWIPYTMSGGGFDARGNRGFQVVARLAPGATIDAARSELDVISRQLEQAYPDTNAKRGVEVSPLSVEVVGQLRPVVLTLMAAVTFVLLIACANVANLLLGRSEARQKEIAVRTALGAGQGRLMRQLLTESVVLASIGALAGLGVAQLALRLLVATSPVTLPSFARPGLNGSVLLFTLGVALLCGVVVGLAPALHTRLTRLADVLKDTARGSSGVRSQRLRGALVVAEMSLAIVLLIGAGLLMRSVQNLTAVDPGFETGTLLSVNLNIPRLPAPAAAAPIPSATPPAAPAPPPPLVVPSLLVLERVRAVAGVTAASLSSDLPLTGGSSAVFYAAEGAPAADAQTMPRAYVHRVTPEFFETMGMAFKAGRTFDPVESRADSTAVVVSESVVLRFWTGVDPIGKRIRIGNAPWLTVVGVVPEVKYRALPRNPTPDPDLYFPFVDRPAQGLLVRTSGDPAAVAQAVRAAVRSAHSSILVFNMTPVSDLVNAQTSASRFTTWLMGVFASVALLLAVVGIYGVMSYLVTQRTREFGIRLALGATRGGIVGVVLRQGATLVGIGAAIGIAVALGLTQLLGDLLFGVGAVDVSSGVAVFVLIATALLACLVPALRATRVDPVVALRSE